MKLLTVIVIFTNVLIMCNAATVTNTTTTPKSVSTALTIPQTGTKVQTTLTTESTPITIEASKKSQTITVKKAAPSTNFIDPVTHPSKTLEKSTPPKRAIASAGAVNANAVTVTTKKPKSVNGTDPMDKYECPETESFQLFPKLCTKHGECITEMGSDHRCCKQYGNRRCVKATARYIAEPKHSPLLGIIPRKCPKEPLAELFWQLHTCESDQDCWPRICCPDGAYKYCRTSTPELEKSNYRVAKQLATPLESASQYIQCTPPPPGGFDKFPKKCNTTFDCFPNVCCQEEGKKHCRPPRRSLLALVYGFASNFNILRRFTTR